MQRVAQAQAPAAFFSVRRIKKANIQFISLVPRGANKMPVLYKADGTVEFETLVKVSADAGELTAIVYAPEHRDSQGDIASAAVIRDMAHRFQKEGGQIDIRHDGKPVGRDRAYVAESFVVQKGDVRFADLKDYDGRAVDATGAWAVVIKVEDSELRRLYREGAWNGVSMAGRAEVVTEKADDEAPGWFISGLKRLFAGRAVTKEDEIDMDKQELQDALKGFAADIVKALKPEAPATPAPEDKKVEKKAEDKALDLNDSKAVEAHLKKLRQDELAKGVDFSDPKQVEAYLAKLKGEQSEEPTSEEPSAEIVEKDEDTDEVKELKRRLRKAEGRSNQGEPDSGASFVDGISKEQAKAAGRGSAMAKFINEQRR